jgi:hypothetical protein
MGVALYSESALTFWRVLAVVAVFHFVRQQYGWVNLYRAKLKEKSDLTWWIDAAAIYLATVYPLAFWMTSLPRNFEWFVENDFFNLPRVVEQILFPVYVLALITYFGKSIYLYFTEGFLNIGKDIVVVTTAVCWYVGIVAFNSDYAFTVTNVIIHGVPYFALVYFYARQRRESAGGFTNPCRVIGLFFSPPCGLWLTRKKFSGIAAYGTSARFCSARIGRRAIGKRISCRCSPCRN